MAQLPLPILLSILNGFSACSAQCKNYFECTACLRKFYSTAIHNRLRAVSGDSPLTARCENMPGHDRRAGLCNVKNKRPGPAGPFTFSLIDIFK